jgi:hypothetical protein
MRLTRRSLFAMLPGGLFAKWFKPSLIPSRHYDMIINDDVMSKCFTSKCDCERYPLIYANDNQFWVLRRAGFEAIPTKDVYL